MEYELGEGGFGRVIAATRKADNVPVRKGKKIGGYYMKKNKKIKETKEVKRYKIIQISKNSYI